MIEIKPPTSFIDEISKENIFTIFLAGSIEMGKAINWQDKIVEALKDEKDLVILNPRRDNWDSSWKQTIDNPNFVEQVDWELEGIGDADLVVFYFDPETISPITLMELGTCKNKKAVVCCPDGYFRKGNVDIFCKKYRIYQEHDLTSLIHYIKISKRWFPLLKEIEI